MMSKRVFLLILTSVILALVGCADKKVEPPKPEEFLTLADLSGSVNLKEDSPGVRVIRIKAKAFIKRNDIRAAKAKAMEVASAQAVDTMVRELLSDEDYNNNFANIGQNNQLQFKCYPNPFKSQLNIYLDNVKKTNVFIYDIHGKIIKDQIIESGKNEIMLNTSCLKNGMYLVLLKNSQNISIQKIIKN